MNTLLKNVLVNGTTYGALGVVGLASTASAQSTSMPDVSGLPPNYAIWVIVATLVLQSGAEIVKAIFLNKNKDDRK